MPNRRIEEEALDAADLRQNPSAVPRVYVVSDVRLYREGLISSLARQSELNVLGAGSSGEFLGRIGDLQPEALLLDLAAHDGFAIPRRAQEILPSLRVVAFAVADADENVLACAEAGISGYVTQDGSVTDLVTAILSALKGELECSPRTAALLLTGWRTCAVDDRRRLRSRR